MQIFIEALSRRGFQITVFTLHYPFVREEYNWKNCSVIPLNGANSKVKKQFFLFGMLKRAFSEKNRKQPFDLIHTFWLNEATYFGQKLSAKFEIPMIATAMGQDVLNSNLYRSRVLSKNFLLVVLSEFHAQFLAEKNAEIIPFGVKKLIENKVPKTNDLIFIGSLSSLKNPLYFLQLVKELDQTELYVKLIGSGPEHKKCLEFITHNGLTNVTLMGECSYEETQAHLAESKLLIHCSSYESFGMIFIEAMSLGAHVLSSPVGFAYNNPSIHSLTFDLKKDAENMRGLLSLTSPVPKIYSVEETVSAYLRRYNLLWA